MLFTMKDLFTLNEQKKQQMKSKKMKENENLCMLTRHNLSHSQDSDSRFEYLFCTMFLIKKLEENFMLEHL